MATTLLPFRLPAVRASADAGRNPDRKASSSSSSWWTPLFGWPSDPEYIDSGAGKPDLSIEAASGHRSEADLVRKAPRSRFSRGCLTPEKAKQLRKMTTEAESFHDAMYHSAIASRLASDFSKSCDP